MQCVGCSLSRNYCPFSVLNLLKSIFPYLWNSWAVLCRLLRGVWMAVTAHWIWNCSVLNGRFLKHQQHWEVHYGHSYSCPNASSSFIRRSWGVGFNRNTWSISRREKCLTLLSLKWGSTFSFFFLFFFSLLFLKRKIYTFFSLWKGQVVWLYSSEIKLYLILNCISAK